MNTNHRSNKNYSPLNQSVIVRLRNLSRFLILIFGVIFIVSCNSGRDFASIVSSGRIPSDLSGFDKSSQAIFGGYNPGAAVIPRYVLPGRSGSGSSWSNAAGNLKNVLDGIIDASPDKVYVLLLAPGRYKAGSTMAMKNYVTIVGGVSFSNIPLIDRTILSGDNMYQVFNNNGLTAAARLYGVIIADGKAERGGGMYNDSSSPFISETAFSSNRANQDGGAMYNKNSSPLLSKMLFINNTANQDGAGVYNESSSPVLTEVIFSENTASQNGGGMANLDSSTELDIVLFYKNTADGDFLGGRGGGMYNSFSSPVLSAVSFAENRANQDGGGIYNNNSSLLLTKTGFLKNRADQNGGGMYNKNSSSALTKITFIENSANQDGGGMYNMSSPVVMIGVLFSENTAEGQGGGMVSSYSSSTVVNSIFWGNRSGNKLKQIYFYNKFNPVSLNLYNTIVEGGMPNGYSSGTTVTDLNGGGLSSGGGDMSIMLNFSDIITSNPHLSPKGAGINKKEIQADSPAVNEGLYVKRSAEVTGQDINNNPTYTFYYSRDKSTWHTSPGLTKDTASLPPVDAIDLTATDKTGYTVKDRPDIGVYEARYVIEDREIKQKI